MTKTFLELEKTLSFTLEALKTWVFPLVRAWWWILPPFLLIKPALFFWLWWRRELSHKAKEYIVLEIKIPEEITKPIRAMEDVFASLAIIDITPGNFREKWIEGDSKIWFPLSCEIASLGGKTHFFMRIEKPFRQIVESAIYSQYPDVEIEEVEDYTKFVPQDIPNENWELEGREFKLKKKDCYPIKTYSEFEPREGIKEEKRVDPLSTLLEGMATLKEGEHLWIQILLHPAGSDWIEEGKKERNKLVKRPSPKKPKPLIQEAIELFLHGPPKKEEKTEMIPPEMKLTPGEKEIVEKIENKISKPGFETSIRYLYLAKRDVFSKINLHLVTSFFSSYNTEHLNKFKTIAETTTKVKSTFFWFLDKRRAFLRKRKMFRNYIMRVPPYFPSEKAPCVLNTEELASIFHFPGRRVAPAPLVLRIEAKKAGPPPELPSELL